MPGFPAGSKLLLLCPLCLPALPACIEPVGEDTPYHVAAITTGPLAGTAGRAVAETLVAELRTYGGEPVPGELVHWSARQGGRLEVMNPSADDASAGTTDAAGRSYAVWTLGLPEGQQTVRAGAGPADGAAEFSATATVLHATSVTAGVAAACALLLDGRPVCWGLNFFGQLGTGDSSYAWIEYPKPVAGLAQALELRINSGGRACARDLAGDVWCWGRNEFGEAGPAAAQPIQLTPVRVPGAEGASGVASSSGIEFGFACASIAGVGVRCWGDNRYAQLGTGDFVSSSTPRDVVGSSGLSRVSVSGGGRSCAVDGDGEAWCWGKANDGELAPLPDGLYLAPVRPVPGHRYTSLAAGDFAVCGIEVFGTVSCFGRDIFGSFGMWPHTELGPGDAPVGPEFPHAIDQIVNDGYDATYLRSRPGLGYVWGETGCCDVFTIPPAMITPTIRIIDVTASEDRYCVLSEAGGVYCGRPNWWYFGEPENLAGIPDSVDS